MLGARVVGLSTAYHLAKRRDKNPGHRVIVIDGQADLYAGTSRYSSGILSDQWFSGDLRTFAGYCYTFCGDLGSRDGGFKKQAGYRENSEFRLTHGGSPSIIEAPDWIDLRRWRMDAGPLR